MRIADLADRFADTLEAANDISPDAYSALLDRIEAVREEASAPRDLLEQIEALQSYLAAAREQTSGVVTAITSMLEGIEKIGEQETVPPVQYVDVVAFQRLLNRVNAMQTYLTGASAAIPTALSNALSGIKNVPKS